MRNIKRFVTVLISAITEGIGWHPAHVRNKGFCLTSKELCRRKCITVLWQEHACPLSTIVAWWPFIKCDEYWVKEVAFKKKGAKTDTIYFGIEYLLLYAYIICPHPSTQLNLISPLTSLWPWPTLVPTLPRCLLWLLRGSRQNKPLKAGVQTHVGNASYHLCKKCERRNSASEVIDSLLLFLVLWSQYSLKNVF